MVDPGRGISPPRMDPGRGISPPRLNIGSRISRSPPPRIPGLSPPRMDSRDPRISRERDLDRSRPYGDHGRSPPRMDPGRGISPPRMARGVILMDQRRSKSPQRYPQPTRSSGSPPRRSNSPGLGYFLNLPKPAKPKEVTVNSDLEKYWRDQMSSITSKSLPQSIPQVPSRPSAPSIPQPQRSSNTRSGHEEDFERIAMQEAMAEQRRLEALKTQSPAVIDLAGM